jgi:hypothetical protein
VAQILPATQEKTRQILQYHGTFGKGRYFGRLCPPYNVRQMRAVWAWWMLRPNGKICKKKTRVTLRNMAKSEKEAPRMRIMTLHPAFDWSMAWKNYGNEILPDRVRSMWYRVVHDILPTNVQMYRIHLSDTDRCKCDTQDNLLHRLTERDESSAIWQWTRFRLALIQRIAPCHIPSFWLLFPSFTLWSRAKHQATLWFLAHMVYYVFSSSRGISVIDYLDFMRRARWKMYQDSRRMEHFGKYLDVF